MTEALIPMVVCTGMFAMIFGIVYLRNRENNPKLYNSGPRPFVNLKYGLLLVGAGLGLLIAYLLDGQMDHKALTPAGTVYYKDNPAIYFSLIAIGGGLGLIISYVIEKKHLPGKTVEE
jgi:hypothetical protein